MNQSATLGMPELVQSFALSELQSAQLTQYVELLFKWNRVHNLTAIRDPRQALIKHLADSLAIAPYFTTARRVLDVGSGAGLPGIVLAVCQPQQQWVLIEKSAKRCAFLQQVVHALALPQVQVIAQDVARYQVDPAQQFDVITARAFSTPQRLIELSQQVLAPKGHFALMVARDTQALRAIPAGWQVMAHHAIGVLGQLAPRGLLCLSRAD